MGMYSLIEDGRLKALDAALRWHETPEAKELLAKLDVFERCSDHWAAECPQAAEAFSAAAGEIESALDDLRGKALAAAADTYSTDRQSDEWLDAQDAADNETPSVAQAAQSARRNRAGDELLLRIAA